MDYFLLPEKIKSQLPPPGEKPPFVMNASGGLDGASGECYIVVDQGLASIFHKSIGVDGFSRLDVRSSDPKFSVSVKRDKFNVMLELGSSAWLHRMKFSSFDAQRLEALASELTAGRKAAPAPSQTAPASADAQPDELDPFVGLLAATMFIASDDSKIDVSEDALIKVIAGDDAKALADALKVYKSCSALELATALSGLDREGRLCVLANMFDVAIADGVLRSSEQRMLSEFAQSMGLSQEDYATVRDVLVAKGKVSFLKAAH